MAKKKGVDSPSNNIVLDRIDRLFEHHKTLVSGIILALFAILSLLLFNLRVSEGGDDSTYIIRAVNFLNEGSYPSFQGPLYPMVLSLVVALFGINLGLLKITSLVFMLGSMWLFYRLYVGRVRYSVLFATMSMLAVSHYFIYFTSQTYSEALFLLLQLPVFIFLFKDIDQPAASSKGFKSYKYLLLVSLFIVLGYLTRTVGIGALLAVIAFYIFLKQYKKAGMILAAFIIILIPLIFIKMAIWNNGLVDGGQASTLIYKHPYDLEQGKETLSGFFGRFVDNSNLYLSKHFLKMTGLRGNTVKSVHGFLTLLLYGLFGFGLFKALRKNKYILFTGIYVAAMLGITFFALQRLWDQYRLIIPFFPFMLVIVLYALSELTRLTRSKMAGYGLAGIVLIALLGSLGQSFNAMDLVTLRSNFKGDRYKGYTADWEHYLQMTEYVGKNLPQSTYVACRKPNMARIYANGKKFYGIYRFDTQDADSLLMRLKERNVTHVIMASLRKNPAIKNGQTINTIQRYLYWMAQKYPNLLQLEHQIGTDANDEPAYLFRINYAVAQP